MLKPLPKQTIKFMSWQWSQIEPYFQELADRSLTADTVEDWLADWSRLNRLLSETFSRLKVAVDQNTTDKVAEERYNAFLEKIFPAAQAAEQKLKEKLLASGLEPRGFAVPLRNMRTEAAIFREANLPLLIQERKQEAQYDKIIGAQTVIWQGVETTIAQLAPVYQNPDRSLREQAWRLAAERQLADREAINTLWQQFLQLRRQLAANAGFKDYRSFRWQQLLRFDYTPEDSYRFHDAIEKAVVPAARRIYEKRRRRLGVKTLRPWDLKVDPLGRPPLRPFQTGGELMTKSAAIFHQVDPALGKYFNTMIREKLLDLENRKGKAPGGYCTAFPVIKRPFIFMNAVGLHNDVQTLLHEAGHAFHVFERSHLPYHQQMRVAMEFNEVASMSMELLAAPYLEESEGGFYSTADAARARIEHLEDSILFWPYMAVVDAFQHWVYEHPDAAADPANCDARWQALWQRFMVGVDWSGLEDALVTGWQRKLHIHTDPFYYIEYGLAQLGAVQVWSNALQDQAGAVVRYRRALALGGTVPLPQLYATAGAKLAFDAETLGEAVTLMEKTIAELESATEH